MEKRALHGFAGFPVFCAAAFPGGCSDVPLLDPKGPIGAAELSIIGISSALMLIVVIPTIVMAFWFSFRYRASAPRGRYNPEWNHSHKIDLVVWGVPIAIITALGVLNWKETHRLDPFEPLGPPAGHLNIEVVSLDWKWLFIYPDRNIASVNQLVLPVNIPVSFRITSGTVMSSFFIPHLGSQIYAMPGMQSRLHLLASEPGVYFGLNTQFSGRGFSDMNFNVRVASQAQFEAWIEEARQSPHRLDRARFDELCMPGVGYPVTSFSWVEHGLFDGLVDRHHATLEAT